MTFDEPAPRRRRADARRNVDALLEAARTVFDTSGVDAPAKEITDLAGVGVGTLYRHFPQRSDLVKAVVESGIDAVADAGPALGAAHAPMEALTKWVHRFTEFLGTKRGLASALHSGDPAFDGLPDYFMRRLGPVLAALLDAAAATGAIRDDVGAEDLLYAIAQLCQPMPGRGPEHGSRMAAVLVDGLRRGASRERQDLYSVVPVSDRAKAVEWFGVFFGRAADEVIGEEYLWQVGENAWVVVDDRDVRAGRVGKAMITFGVTDLDDILARLAANGIGHEPVETYGNGVRHVDVLDPDGNSLSLAEAPAE